MTNLLAVSIHLMIHMAMNYVCTLTIITRVSDIVMLWQLDIGSIYNNL